MSQSDIEIARQQELQHIHDVASKVDLKPEDLILFGDHKAKVKMDTINRILNSGKEDAPLILVTATNPTDAGEGKTTTSIGLTQALNQLGKKTTVALREPSMGPSFGKKGGAAGGGYSQVLPMEDINLHFTGDFHAITSANNLISAALDNHFYFGNEKRLSPYYILWRRVMDMNDRGLRDIVTGQTGNPNAPLKETGFDITPASAIMAILCLSHNYSELKEKIGDILLGFTQKGGTFNVRDLNVHGAAAALMKEAMLPNLVQTVENGPAFIHGGPFANIAQGANSVLATKLAMKLSDYAVTEAGFGSDLGAEKFVNIVGRYGEFMPTTIVLVATARSLKMHGGVSKDSLNEPNPDAVKKGAENLQKHIDNIRKYGAAPVVAVNRFPSDSHEELQVIEGICKEEGVDCAIVNYREEGGKGGLELAEKVVESVDKNRGKTAQPLYDLNKPVEEKIRKVARDIYGAEDVQFTLHAEENLRMINEHGLDNLPVCMAKTQKSLSDDPKLLGRPTGFTINVREILVSSGAGFLIPLTGKMMRMPGLPRVPAAESIDIDDNGDISGLF